MQITAGRIHHTVKRLRRCGVKVRFGPLWSRIGANGRDAARLRGMPSRVTLQDVADRAGTSRTTAHYVLTGRDREMRIAEGTRRRVLRAANELRYRPNLMARGLRTRVTRTIAFISDTVATEAYAGDLVYGALAT